MWSKYEIVVWFCTLAPAIWSPDIRSFWLYGQFLVGPDFPILKIIGYMVKISVIWSKFMGFSSLIHCQNDLSNALSTWVMPISDIFAHLGFQIP